MGSTLQATLNATIVSKSYSQVSTQACWKSSMQEELQALQDKHLGYCFLS